MRFRTRSTEWTSTPPDWKNPEWQTNDYKDVHEWTRYISHEIREYWGTFNDKQKLMLAINAQSIADEETWD